MELADKTLVAWVSPADLEQHGGSVLTLDDKQSHFDGIIFGELTPAKWMAGSDVWRRSQKEQGPYPTETAAPGTFVQVAITYEGKRVSLYREGACFATYEVDEPLVFGDDCMVMFGKRHYDTGDAARFRGAIEDARIYDRALTAEEIAALRPNEASATEPLAWWTFEEGITDVMGRFPETIVRGGVTVADGKMVLQGEDPTVIALAEEAVYTAARQPALTVPAMVAGQRQLREKFLADRQRPAYHFVSPEGACVPFDANGAIYWHGRYHLFYIFQDERGHCWGHVSSKDMLHWRWHTTGLYPAPGNFDRGIFSGNCFVNKEGEATILYHGIGAGNCIATCAEPTLDHWRKLASNPIIAIPAAGTPEASLYSSWDPHGWVEGDTYYAIFGGGKPTVFKATKLDDWSYVGPLLAHDMPDVEPGEDVSCPDLFPIGDKYMLMGISHNKGARYYIGEWRNEQFHPEYHARMNWDGGYTFAPETLVDDQGRRIMWAWVMDRAGQEPMHEGWSGIMTLPRVLSLDRNTRLRIEPIQELESLRGNPRRYTEVALADGLPVSLNGLWGDCLEIRLRVRAGDAQRIGLKVRCAPDGSEETPIVVDRAANTIRVELAKSSADPFVVYHARCLTPLEHNYTVTEQVAPFTLTDAEELDLRLFLDRSIVEIYANARQCVTQRIYPRGKDSFGIVFFAEGGDATITVLEAWDMAPTVPW